MTNARSIAGLAIARQILEVVHAGTVRGHLGPHQYFARLTPARNVACEISIRPPKPFTYGTVRSLTTGVFYVRGTALQRSRAINTRATKLIRQWAAERVLHEARERLYQLAETRVVPDAWGDPGGSPLPRPQTYSDMSLEDVEAWTPLIQALPRKS